MEEKINYSFIIPHKNCPDLLRRCVDSIPKRDDIQIIVVDDNSDEGKKPDLDRKDVEVIMLDAEHSKGAGRARNVGLTHAKGKWLLFADADDYYTENLNGLLDKYAADESIEIVYLNASVFDEYDNTRVCNISKLIDNYIQEKPGAEMEIRYNYWTPWSRMVKRDKASKYHIQFDEIPAGNDLMFGLKCSKICKHMTIEEKIIYLYYRPTKKNSQTDRCRNRKMLNARLKMTADMCSLYKEVHYPPKPSFFNVVFNSIYSKDVSLGDKVKIYKESLAINNLSFIVDFYRYVFRKIYYKKNDRIRVF